MTQKEQGVDLNQGSKKEKPSEQGNPEARLREAEKERESCPGWPAHYIRKLKESGFEKQAKVLERVVEISRTIKEAGGRALLVGGAVRDYQLGLVSKDYDLEVYNLPPEKLEGLIGQFGKVSDVGRSFGVLKLTPVRGVDIDISLPRTDSKIAAGHRGFKVKADPFMSVVEAARRRDFTINSMALDPLTGQIEDPFDGLKDLRERCLRITDPERFRDDPLRVMRALQFIARFGLELEPKSAEVIQEMAPQLRELPKARILEEWKKLLLKAEKPSLGLAAGLALGILKEIHPQLPPLAETGQDPGYHPEGDVWTHVLMSVDQAACLIRESHLEEERAWVVILSVLCHDLGKPLTTSFKEGRLVSPGHEAAGQKPTKDFLDTLGVDKSTKERVLKLVANHLAPTLLYNQAVIRKEKIGDGAIRRLAQRIHPATIEELVLVAEADWAGRGPFRDSRIPEQILLPLGYYPAGPWLLKRARQLRVEQSKPADLIRGRELLGLGYQPGPVIGEIIRLANDLRDKKELGREEILILLSQEGDPEKAIDKLKQLLED